MKSSLSQVNPFVRSLVFQLAAHDITAMYSEDLAETFRATTESNSNLEDFGTVDLINIMHGVRSLIETRLFREEAEWALKVYESKLRDYLSNA